MDNRELVRVAMEIVFAMLWPNSQAPTPKH